MKIKSYMSIYFSATGSTKRTIQAISHNIGASKAKDVNITLSAQSIDVEPDTLSIIGIPIYCGRVAPTIAQNLKNIRGNGNPAVIVVVYGNRDYDDAMLELKNLMEAQGFYVVAAMAVVAEHSLVRSIATGRPDKKDMKDIKEFCRKIKDKIKSDDLSGSVKVKGNFPYKEFKMFPLHPKASNKCEKCGMCALNCPAKVIPLDAPNKTIDEKCISCMRCVSLCPVKARSLSFLKKVIAASSLKKKCRERKQAELFL